MRIDLIKNRLCHITFDNKVTVSISIGGGSYSDNHDDIELIGHEQEHERVSSGTAELAAWKHGGEWITEALNPDSNDGQVIGWQDTAQILDFLNKASQYQP